MNLRHHSKKILAIISVLCISTQCSTINRGRTPFTILPANGKYVELYEPVNDLIVVLPVMQSDTDLNNSNLHHLYTITPIAAVIGNGTKDVPTPNPIAPIPLDKRMDTVDLVKDSRPYTGFPISNQTSDIKFSNTPLEYGYPDSLKFIKVLNDMPKNHKPEWAPPTSTERHTPIIEQTTKGDPFQMFESVKPIEINKLLSFKSGVVPDVIESVTEKSTIKKPKSNSSTSTKGPPQKLSNKKPLKKQQKVTEADSVPKIPNTAQFVSVTTNEPELKDTTSALLPTPFRQENLVATRIRHVILGSSTERISTIAFNLQRADSNNSTIAVTTPNLLSVVEPSDLISLTRIPGENFQINSSPTAKQYTATTINATTPTPTNQSLFPDDAVSSDVKNTLVAMGIVKSEIDAVAATKTHSNIFGSVVNTQLVIPTIDPESYVNFKKIPAQVRIPVSDEMRILLDSFGLLSKNKPLINTPISKRLSRHSRISGKINDEANTTNQDMVIPEELKNTLENLGVLQSLSLNYQPDRNGHVFQPTQHLEKLAKQQKIKQINEAMEAIRKLSKNKQVNNESIEQIVKQLETLTAAWSTNEDDDTPTDTTIKNSTVTKIVQQLVDKIPIVNESVAFYPSDQSDISFVTFDTTTRPRGELNSVLGSANPLTVEELQFLSDTNKKEVKRQQSNDTFTSQTDNASMDVTDRVESNNNAAVSDLAASFGGGETAGIDVAIDSASTTTRNGLYFYVDWNSFLHVGEGEKNPIRVRFSPRAGNARNFLNITVP